MNPPNHTAARCRTVLKEARTEYSRIGCAKVLAQSWPRWQQEGKGANSANCSYSLWSMGDATCYVGQGWSFVSHFHHESATKARCSHLTESRLTFQMQQLSLTDKCKLIPLLWAQMTKGIMDTEAPCWPSAFSKPAQGLVLNIFAFASEHERFMLCPTIMAVSWSRSSCINKAKKPC